MIRIRLLIAAFAAVGFVSGSVAQHAGDTVQVGDLAISHASTIENAENAHPMRVYLTIENSGDADDRLIGASVPFAGHVQLRHHVLKQKMARPTDIEAITIEAGQTTSHWFWIELEGIQKTFRPGQHFPMELTFETVGTVSVKVAIRPLHRNSHKGLSSNGLSRSGERSQVEPVAPGTFRPRLPPGSSEGRIRFR